MNCLTPAELHSLTGHRRYDAQVKALQAMGIVYRVRPNKTVAVLKEHAENILGLKKPKDRAKRIEPNFDGLHA